jgi:hypothetical protein
MNKFTFSANDVFNQYKEVNRKFGTNYTIDQINKLSDSGIFTFIDNLESQNQASDLFGGVTINNDVDQYAFILAFLLGNIDFIKKYKCTFNAPYTFLDGNVQTHTSQYNYMKMVVNASNSLNKTNLNSDPFLNFDKFADDCDNSEKKKTKKKTNFGDTTNINKNVASNISNDLLLCGIASLLFMLLSNHLAYKGTNILGGLTLNKDDCPSDLGIIIHGVVFFGLFFAVVKYLK